MSIEAYEQKLFESVLFLKLKEAELEANSTKKRFSHDEVFSDLRANVNSKIPSENA